jgi:hypothetical protein
MPIEIPIRQRAARPRERMNSPLGKRKVRLRGLGGQVACGVPGTCSSATGRSPDWNRNGHNSGRRLHEFRFRGRSGPRVCCTPSDHRSSQVIDDGCGGGHHAVVAVSRPAVETAAGKSRNPPSRIARFEIPPRHVFRAGGKEILRSRAEFVVGDGPTRRSLRKSCVCLRPITPSHHHTITPSHHHTITPSHPFTRSPVHPFTRSPVHPFTRSPVHRKAPARTLHAGATGHPATASDSGRPGTAWCRSRAC